MNDNSKHRPDIEIQALVSKALDGNQSAFTILYKQLKPFAKSIIYKRVFKISYYDSKLLAHEIVSHILIKVSFYNNQKAHFFSWASQLANNYIIDNYRQSSRIISPKSTHQQDTLIEYLNPERILLEREKRNLVKSAIQKLPEEKQSIINDYSLGLPIKEIAIKNKKSEGAISIDIFRIKSQIIKTISQGEK